MTSIHLTDAPAIPGLSFRRLRDPGDYPGMAAVRSGSSDWDQVDLRSAREEVPTGDELAATLSMTEMRGHPDL